MTTTTQIAPVFQIHRQQPFSLSLYLLLIFTLTWALQIAYALRGSNLPSGSLVSSFSMMMVAAGAFNFGTILL